MLICQLHMLVTCLHVCIRAALGQTAADDCPVPVQVLVKDSASTSGHRLRFGPSGPDQDSTCEVSWISHELFSLEREASTEGADTDVLDSAVLSQDFVLTDGLKRVPFAGRKGRLAFLERILPMPRLDSEQLDSILAGKELLISVLLPRENSKAWADVQTRTIAQQAAAVLPDHTFFDDGLAVTYEQAFVPYRFSLIVDDDNGTVSQAFVHCIAWGTIPLFNGFSHMVAMLPRIVVPWDPVSFRLEALLSFLPGINYDIASLWQQHRLVQDLCRIEQHALHSGAFVLSKLKQKRSHHAHFVLFSHWTCLLVVKSYLSVLASLSGPAALQVQPWVQRVVESSHLPSVRLQADQARGQSHCG